MFSLGHRFIRLVTRRFWTLLLGSIIAFAVLVQIARQAFLLINDYRDVLEDSLSDQLGVELSIGSVNANWRGLRFELLLTDIDVFSKTGEDVFQIGVAQAELSLIDSLIQRGMAWRTITFEDFQTSLVQNKNHTWKIKGYDGGTANTDNPFMFDDPLDIFLFGRRVEIRSATLLFEFSNGKVTELSIPNISLENDRFFHRMNVALNVDGENTLNFVVEGYGDPRNKENFSSSGYLEINSIALMDVAQAILSDEKIEEFKPLIEDGLFNFALWFKGSPESGMTASGQISIDGLSSEDVLGVGFAPPQRIESRISGLWSRAVGWQMALREPLLSWEEEQLKFSDVGFYGQNGQVGMRLAELKVEDLVGAIQKNQNENSKGFAKVLNALNPKGTLNHIELSLKPAEQGYFLMRAKVSDASTQAFMGSPAFENVNGYVEANMLGGYVDVNSTDGFSMHLTKIFDEAFELDRASGQVAWRIDLENKEAFLESSVIQGVQDETRVLGSFALELPFNRDVGEQRLSLLINADQASALEYPNYLPKNVNASLKTWLSDAVRDGKAENISVLYHGSVNRNPTARPVYQVAADFNDVDLQFDKRWPLLQQSKGRFLIDSNSVFVDLESARSLENQVVQAELNTIDIETGLALSVQANLQGKGKNAKHYVLSSPLKSRVDGFLPDWQWQGDYEADIALTMPFTFKEEQIDYQVDVRLRDNHINMTAQDIQLSKLNGSLRYSKNHGLQSDEFVFELWDKPFSAKANSDNPTKDIVFEFSGELNTSVFKSWIKRPEFIFIDGNTQLEGTLHIPTLVQSELLGIQLSINSDLSDLEVDLPEPFYKHKDDVLDSPARLTMRLAGTNAHYDYHHAELFSLDVWSSKGEPAAMVMKVGEKHIVAEANEVISFSPSVDPGIVNISGAIPSVDYSDWLVSIERLVSAGEKNFDGDAQHQASTKINIDLDVDQFSFFDIDVPDLRIHIENTEEAHWMFHGESDILKGYVELPDNDEPISINLDYLAIHTESSTENEDDSLENSEQEESKKASVLADVDISKIPMLNVNVGQLSIDDTDWGEWSFITKPLNQGVLFDEVKASSRKLKIGHSQPSQFYWFEGGNIPISRFIGTIEAGDIGTALEAWDLDRLMESESARFDLDISWNNAPDLIALPLLYGDVSVNIQNGSFLRGAEAGENPILRLIALFNFDTLARRLRLDFSDLAAKGFSFDTVDTVLRFDEGVAIIQDPLVVKSSSSKMRMVGALNLIEEDVDAELVVTLPVAGNLAVATAFAAGLPAGLGVYIISKMFDKHVDKVSSISYSVEGPWEDPKVKVQRVFDNKTEKKTEDKTQSKIEKAAQEKDTDAETQGFSGDSEGATLDQSKQDADTQKETSEMVH